MNESAQKYATYWRNSLADASSARGAWWGKDDLSKLIALPPTVDAFQSGVLDSKIVASLFKGEKDNLPCLDLIFWPKVYRRKYEHGKQVGGGLPVVVTPLLCFVQVYRDGSLKPTRSPLIARDILEPVDNDAFTVGAVADLDDYLTKHEWSYADNDSINENWRNYIRYCDALMSAVVGKQADEQKYEKTEDQYLSKSDSQSNTALHILALYDDMRKNKPDSPLFASFAGSTVPLTEACLPKNSLFTQRCGHSSDRFPLADAQRDALAHLMAAGPGEIMAVNGPPGTGKTTLLLSVVASLWVKAALVKGDPPVIVAASSNNLAVSNIIDAFGKDFSNGSGDFSGRWLPGISSFGSYFPSQKKEGEASAKYQTAVFFDKVESLDYIAEARSAYIAAGRRAFPNLPSPTITSIIDAIHGEMMKINSELTGIAAAWSNLVRSRENVKAELGEDPHSEIAVRGAIESQAATQEDAARKVVSLWQEYLAQESIWFAIFNWVPAIGKKRFAKAYAAMNRAGVRLDDDLRIDDVQSSLDRQVEQCIAARTAATSRLEDGMNVLRTLGAAEETWLAVAPPASPDSKGGTLADADAGADTGIRFKLFLLATHYWEGRWLESVIQMGNKIESNKKARGRSAVEPRWRRRMMLTPCAVSTLFMLPSHIKCRRKENENFIDNYLYNFIDLLIIDEAGQVLPEVAGASFALAKRALVIGDTLQIEPIWSVTGSVDNGNLISSGILPPDATDEDLDRINDLGKTASTGSVMRVAQNVSQYHQVTSLPRGLFLFEHRRCYEEIIQFSNQLCYQGSLIPCRENTPSPTGLPAMGYLHVDGLCTQGGSGGSRKNEIEAKAVASWLADHKDMLETAYGEPIHKVVGIITPFKGQAEIISRECKKKNLKAGTDGDGVITVGTVHSLQGAERRVIIFSPTYSKHSDGPFIDRSASLLNVAVSRAKDSFLVFGDMDTFDQRMVSTPRGLLASILFPNPDNVLSYPAIQRPDISGMNGEGFRVLRDYEEHDKFLQEAILYAKQNVMIVTPWFHMGKLKGTGALRVMEEARSRGVDVTIYTDRDFNQKDYFGGDKALASARKLLGEYGIKFEVVNKVHSKIAAFDSDLLCLGSFNWFSANRTKENKNHETSMVYRGDGVEREIEANRVSLQKRLVAGF